ncbi:MAG: general secretion pathway protein GspB [Rhodanobacteraceae bacterium]
MSLILEALKKSEQQRRLGEVPHLGTPMSARRRPGNWLPILAMAIVVAIALGGWLVLRPHRGASEHIVAGDTVAPRPHGATGAPVRSAEPSDRTAASAGKRAAGRRLPVGKRPFDNKPSTSASGLGTAPGRAPTREATGAAGAPPAKAVAAAPPAKPVGGAKGKSAPPRPAQRQTPPPVRTAAKAPVQPVPAQPAAVASAPANAKPVGHAKPHAPPTTSAPKATQWPMVWELPLKTRTALPKLSMIMHVYSPDPAKRFIVLNGDRHVEGDDINDDLSLVEIRPDGAVLDYKGQRFLLPRNGR